MKYYGRIYFHTLPLYIIIHYKDNENCNVFTNIQREQEQGQCVHNFVSHLNMPEINSMYKGSLWSTSNSWKRTSVSSSPRIPRTILIINKKMSLQWHLWAQNLHIPNKLCWFCTTFTTTLSPNTRFNTENHNPPQDMFQFHSHNNQIYLNTQKPYYE